MNHQHAGADRGSIQLGSGALGRCYLTTAGDGEALVRKTLHADLAEVPELRERFVEAAHRAQTVRHDNVVELISVGQHTDGDVDVPYLVTRHHRAPNLAEELEEHDLSVDAVCEVGVQLCLALSAAHEHGLLHLDLKPENVLIEWTHDGTPMVRVLDFGIAHAVFSHQAAAPACRWAHSPPRHQAPEVLLGQAGRPCSDVYSVGSIMYEALTGISPIHEQDETEAFRAAICGSWKPLVRRNAQLPESLIRAIENALTNDPDERLQDPLTLLRQLILHVDETSPVYAAAKQELARTSDHHHTVATPSLMLQRAPKPRQVSSVPSSRLLSPTFPKSPAAPRIDEVTAFDADPVGGAAPLPAPVDEGLVPSPESYRLDLLTVFAGLVAGFALAWSNTMP